jgi:hypothetical protein
VANTRHDHAEGKSSKRQRGSQAQLRARERIAAERAARKRAELRRRILALAVNRPGFCGDSQSAGEWRNGSSTEVSGRAA